MKAPALLKHMLLADMIFWSFCRILLRLGIVCRCNVRVAEGEMLEELNFKRARDFVDLTSIHSSNPCGRRLRAEATPESGSALQDLTNAGFTSYDHHIKLRTT